jgi:NADH:ubiquinone oxidoreductase subunit 2 (subunit N)
MNSFFAKASFSKYLALAALVLTGFFLFLHPMDPMEFFRKLASDPVDTFHSISIYVQTVVFWISVACAIAGIVGMLLVAVQRWRRKRFFHRTSESQPEVGDGEENWMFL